VSFVSVLKGVVTLNKKFLVISISGLLVMFLSIGALLARNAPIENAYGYLSIFSNVIHLINSNYVEEVDFNKVMDSALGGMVESLDSDSFFLKGDDLELYKKDLEEDRNKAGVGFSIAKRNGIVMVVAVEKGSPADENKIKPGDFIRTIDDQYVQSMPLYQIYHLLKGSPGTQVKVSLFKGALEKPEQLTLVRKAITKPYMESYVAQPKIGYIRIIHLLPGVEKEIETKLASFKEQGVTNLIFDLRDCTEENQEIAIQVANLFVGNSLIVQISGREGPAKKIMGSGKTAFKGNLLVLTDFTTAGSAEIIAGAIQDSGTGKVFGTRTFGRGGIQELVPAGSNWIVLTTQKYLTPKGKMILSNGIDPEIPYKEEVKAADKTEGQDPMLDSAIDYLRHPEQKAA
jgi:carboxyl-terminal processing protease